MAREIADFAQPFRHSLLTTFARPLLLLLAGARETLRELGWQPVVVGARKTRRDRKQGTPLAGARKTRRRPLCWPRLLLNAKFYQARLLVGLRGPRPLQCQGLVLPSLLEAPALLRKTEGDQPGGTDQPTRTGGHSPATRSMD